MVLVMGSIFSIAIYLPDEAPVENPTEDSTETNVKPREATTKNKKLKTVNIKTAHNTSRFKKTKGKKKGANKEPICLYKMYMNINQAHAKLGHCQGEPLQYCL